MGSTFDCASKDQRNKTESPDPDGRTEAFVFYFIVGHSRVLPAGLNRQRYLSCFTTNKYLQRKCSYRDVDEDSNIDRTAKRA